jgi:hypothetical protein
MDTIGVHLIAKSTDKYDPEAFMIYNNVVFCVNKNTYAFLYENLCNLKERFKYYLCCGK